MALTPDRTLYGNRYPTEKPPQYPPLSFLWDAEFRMLKAITDQAGSLTRATRAPTKRTDGQIGLVGNNRPRWDENGMVIQPARTNRCWFNLPGGSEASFGTTGITEVSGLASEEWLEIEAGDDLRMAAGNNWDPNSFVISGWVRPNFSSSSTTARVALRAHGNSSNSLMLRWDGTWDLFWNIGGSSGSISLADTFAAGDAVFLEVRFDGTTLTLAADTDDDGTLDTVSDTPGAVFDESSIASWTLFVGQNSNLGNDWEGGLNLAILNVGSSADPITHRFNSGNGQDIQDWLARIHPDTGHPYWHHLVAYLPKAGDTSSPISFDGASLCDFPGGSGNNVTVDGLTASTAYDYTVTYQDDSTATGSETTDGSGVLTLGDDQANFAGQEVKSVDVVPDGGGATVADIDFTKIGPGRGSFVCETGQTVTVNGDAALRLDPDVGTQLLSNTGFEEYDGTGRYNFDGTDDDINYGDYTDLDGAVEASFWGDDEIGDALPSESETLIGRRSGTGAEQQFHLELGTNGRFNFRISTDLSGGFQNHQMTLAVSANQRFRWFVRVKLDEATDAEKIQMGIDLWDPATGDYEDNWTVEQLGVSGTPATFTTPDPVDLVKGSLSQGIRYLDHISDELRINAGTALSVATLEANTIYSRTDADWDHAWPFDGDAQDAIGTLHGTVTGATQVADGRPPTSWTINLGTPEVDRATGASNREEGYGIRVKESTGSGTERVRQDPLSVTENRWYGLSARARKVGATGTASVTTLNWDNPSLTAPNAASLTHLSEVTEASSTTSIVRLDLEVNAGAEMYVDDVLFYQLSEPGWSTATKGTALPSLEGLGGPWGVADASIVAVPADIEPPYDKGIADEQGAAHNIIELATGPAGSGERKYYLGTPGSLNGLTPGTWYSCVIGVYVPEDSEVGFADVQVHADDDQAVVTDGDAATADGEWQWVTVSRQVDASATAASFYLAFADGVNLSNANQKVYMALPTVVEGRTAPLAIPNAAEGTLAVNRDQVDWDLPSSLVPKGSTYQVVFTPRGPESADQQVVSFGNGNNEMEIELDSAGTLTVRVRVGGTATTHDLGSFTAGQEIEVTVRLGKDGTLKAWISDVEKVSTGVSMPTSFSNQKAVAGQANVSLKRIGVAQSEETPKTMRRAA